MAIQPGPEYVQAMYQSGLAYDAAEGLATELFTAGMPFPEVHRRANELRKQLPSDPWEVNRIGTALNFALFSAALGSEEAGDFAQKLAEHVEQRETIFRIAKPYIDGVKTSYSAECMVARKLLSPRELDNIFLDRFAYPDHADKDYLDGDALAIIVDLLTPETPYFVDVNIDPSVLLHGENTMLTLGIHSKGWGSEGPLEVAVNEAENYMFDEGVSNYHVLYFEDTEPAQYFILRYNVHRMGKLVHERTGLRAPLGETEKFGGPNQ